MPTSVVRGALAAAVALFALAAPATAGATTAPAATGAATVPAATGATAAPAVPAAAGAVVPGNASAPRGTLALPRPTGPNPVGMTTLHLVDDSRPDPWVAEEKSRQLMVSLWYPARTSHGRRAPYMTTRESELLLKGQGVDGVPPAVLSGTRTNAVVDAKPLGHEHGLPLVVLSPGFSAPRGSLTALAEDLASRGYVVAGIDHTHESYGTTLPDGRTVTCVPCGSETSPGVSEKVTRGRAADVSFVLDRLTGPKPAWKGARLIDPSRIAMAGHSIGGNSAPWAMLADSRVRAGINMDGTFFIPLPRKGLSRPFLLIGAGKGPTDPTWKRDWSRMTGWKRWLTVDGADHGSFTDFPLLTEQLSAGAGGSLSGRRAVEITRKYVGAFFDLHLRKKSQPLLERPSKRYPEVGFQR
ncbi:alpha/beta hydrolase family protein [Streptosporangium sp. NPDC000396]|uniref:alpha/beta hydrolase family protein n=1 Tax=Streptosporangium sp. NPDC000396 TaxID=3366185 RepID=UPI0036B6EFEC